MKQGLASNLLMDVSLPVEGQERDLQVSIFLQGSKGTVWWWLSNVTGRNLFQWSHSVDPLTCEIYEYGLLSRAHRSRICNAIRCFCGIQFLFNARPHVVRQVIDYLNAVDIPFTEWPPNIIVPI
jgi:hypothetical protein